TASAPAIRALSRFGNEGRTPRRGTAGARDLGHEADLRAPARGLAGVPAREAADCLSSSQTAGSREDQTNLREGREETIMKVAFYPGCVSRGGCPELYPSAVKVAAQLGLEVEELTDVGCNGARVA